MKSPSSAPLSHPHSGAEGMQEVCRANGGTVLHTSKEPLDFQECIFSLLCTRVPYLETKGSSRKVLFPQTGIRTGMIIRHRDYTGTVDWTKTNPDSS